jgi:hypothetical protein
MMGNITVVHDFSIGFDGDKVFASAQIIGLNIN